MTSVVPGFGVSGASMRRVYSALALTTAATGAAAGRAKHANIELGLLDAVALEFGSSTWAWFKIRFTKLLWSLFKRFNKEQLLHGPSLTNQATTKCGSLPDRCSRPERINASSSSPRWRSCKRVLSQGMLLLATRGHLLTEVIFIHLPCHLPTPWPRHSSWATARCSRKTPANRVEPFIGSLEDHPDNTFWDAPLLTDLDASKTRNKISHSSCLLKFLQPSNETTWLHLFYSVRMWNACFSIYPFANPSKSFNSFLCPFIHSFNHSFTHSLTHSLSQQASQSSMHWFLHWLVQSASQSVPQSTICWCTSFIPGDILAISSKIVMRRSTYCIIFIHVNPMTTTSHGEHLFHPCKRSTDGCGQEKSHCHTLRHKSRATISSVKTRLYDFSSPMTKKWSRTRRRRRRTTTTTAKLITVCDPVLPGTMVTMLNAWSLNFPFGICSPIHIASKQPCATFSTRRFKPSKNLRRCLNVTPTLACRSKCSTCFPVRYGAARSNCLETKEWWERVTKLDMCIWKSVGLLVLHSCFQPKNHLI